MIFSALLFEIPRLLKFVSPPRHRVADSKKFCRPISRHPTPERKGKYDDASRRKKYSVEGNAVCYERETTTNETLPLRVFVYQRFLWATLTPSSSFLLFSLGFALFLLPLVAPPSLSFVSLAFSHSRAYDFGMRSGCTFIPKLHRWRISVGVPTSSALIVRPDFPFTRRTCRVWTHASIIPLLAKWRDAVEITSVSRERVIKWHNYRMVICTSVSTSRRDGVKFHRRVTRRCRNALQLLMRFVGLLEKLKYSLWPLENKQFSERQFRPDPWNNNCTVNSRDRERDEASSVVACLSSTIVMEAAP